MSGLAEAYQDGDIFTYGKNGVESDAKKGYFGVFDGEPDHKGWDKCTVEYAMNNDTRIKSYIRGQILRFSDSIVDDTEEIYQDLLMDLYKAEDYRLILDGPSASSLQSYVYKRLSYIISTFKSNMCNLRNTRKNSTVKDEDGEYIDIFDVIPDSRDDFEQVLYSDVESFLRPLETRRYEFGFDLFQIIYVGVVGNRMQMDVEQVYQVLALLNSTKADNIQDCYLKIMDDDEIASVVLAINKCKDISKLSEHVYGVEQIHNLLTALCNQD